MIGAAVLLTVSGAAWYFSAASDASPPGLPIPGDGGTHFTVEVLNGTDENGLARDVTRALRHRGIDVVYYGSVRDSIHQGTRILIRRGDSAAAIAVREALDLGVIFDAPAPESLLDVSVILGLDAVQRFRLDP